VLGKKVSQNKDGILIQRGTNPSFFASEAANLASLWLKMRIEKNLLSPVKNLGWYFDES
jgi:hypothetical protein